MKKYVLASLVIFLIAMSFMAGSWFRAKTSGTGDPGVRKVLYYVDPMNPGNRYDKPGTAPCGMALEPVYSGGGAAAAGMSSMPSGTVHITPEKQQLVGVRLEQVEKGSSSRSLHLLGKVAADETRIYRINSSVEGWIRKAYPNTTGSLVRKGEPLATYYAPEFLAAEQAYIYALSSLGRFQSSGKETQSQLKLTGQSIQQYEDTLRNLGMDDLQISEIGRTREYTENIMVRSPVTGFVLVRNISPDLRFDKGTELYRIADLRRVWILLDTYEDEARYFHPGQIVPVRYQGKTIKAVVSKVLPEFDPATRTLKVRLEADNPGYMLRPDMFVDVDYEVRMPPALTIPTDAVIDSGLKKTVFVDRGNGYFEPRKVETGRWFDDRVEITSGLRPGERVVVSGNFLIDSESRMKTATAGMSGTGSIDPSCGMMVDEGKSGSEGLTSNYNGKTYYFCSMECKMKFDKSPGKYAEKPATMENMDGMDTMQDKKSMKSMNGVKNLKKPDMPKKMNKMNQSNKLNETIHSNMPSGMEMNPEDMKNGGHLHD